MEINQVAEVHFSPLPTVMTLIYIAAQCDGELRRNLPT